MSPSTAPPATASPPQPATTAAASDLHPAGLRERKKDATRRALAEAALDLVTTLGYPHVTIAQIVERVGVSRRTFSNYFPGKAECLLAVTEGWLDDVLEAVRSAPADCSVDDILCAALERVAAVLPERWERLSLAVQAEPELAAIAGAADAANADQLRVAVAARLGVPADDLRMRLFATYALLAGRLCLDEWLLAGRPAGVAGFQHRLELALSLIDVSALAGIGPGGPVAPSLSVAGDARGTPGP